MAAAVIQSERLEDTLLRHKNLFYSVDNPSLEYEFRSKQLQNLKNVFTCMKEELLEALRKDLGGSRDVLSLTRMLPLIGNLTHAIKSLRSWMKSESVETPLIVAPADHHYQYQPLGVVCILGCWNVPVLAAVLPLISAIAAGNHVIVKLSELSHNTEKVLALILGKALDPRCFSVVTGGVEVSKKLTTLKFDKLVFTGSHRTAQLIASQCAQNLVTYSLFELHVIHFSFKLHW